MLGLICIISTSKLVILSRCRSHKTQTIWWGHRLMDGPRWVLFALLLAIRLTLPGTDRLSPSSGPAVSLAHSKWQLFSISSSALIVFLSLPFCVRLIAITMTIGQLLTIWQVETSNTILEQFSCNFPIYFAYLAQCSQLSNCTTICSTIIVCSQLCEHLPRCTWVTLSPA